jgi:hypothetical protein
MSSAVRRKKRDVACATAVAAATSVGLSPSPLANIAAKKHMSQAAAAAPEARGLLSGAGQYEELGVGRAARIKRFSLGDGSSGGGSSDALHANDNFLLPVAGTVSACLYSAPVCNLVLRRPSAWCDAHTPASCTHRRHMK